MALIYCLPIILATIGLLLNVTVIKDWKILPSDYFVPELRNQPFCPSAFNDILVFYDFLFLRASPSKCTSFFFLFRLYLPFADCIIPRTLFQ